MARGPCISTKAHEGQVQQLCFRCSQACEHSVVSGVGGALHSVQSAVKCYRFLLHSVLSALRFLCFSVHWRVHSALCVVWIRKGCQIRQAATNAGVALRSHLDRSRTISCTLISPAVSLRLSLLRELQSPKGLSPLTTPAQHLSPACREPTQPRS